MKSFALKNSLAGVDLNSEELVASGELPLLNVAVPVNIEKWDDQTSTPLVAYLPEGYDEKTATEITAFDGAGKVHLLDAKTAPTVPVIVISENERTQIEQGKVSLKAGLVNFDKKANARQSAGAEGPGGNTVVCGTMPYDEVLYLTGFLSENLGAIESWANGAPEIRMNIYYTDQSSQAKQIVYGDSRGNLWEPSRRRDVDHSWWRFADRLMRWTSAYGDTINFALWEEDSGNILSIPVSVKGKFFGQEYNASTTVNIKDSDEFIGVFPVDRAFCTNDGNTAYGTQSLKFVLDYYAY